MARLQGHEEDFYLDEKRPQYKWVGERKMAARRKQWEKDRDLEQAGLLNYQNRGMSAAEIAARSTAAGQPQLPIQYKTADNGLVVKQQRYSWWNGAPVESVSKPTYSEDYTQPQLNPYAGDFDWSRLTVEQKKAITGNSEFSMSKVIAPGQQGMILSDKGLGLWSKNQSGTYGSQDLQWWQPVAFSVLSDPKTTPLVQGAAMTLLTGGQALPLAIGITGLAYGAQLKGNENASLNAVGSFSEWMLKPFMAGAFALEQVGGVIDYLVGGKDTSFYNVPAVEAFKTIQAINEANRLEQFISDPKLRKAVWEAGKVYYESLAGKQQPYTKVLEKLLDDMPLAQKKDTIKAINAFLPLVKEENQVWVLGENETVPVQPGYTLDDAVKRILNGESADALWTEYQRVYGISGVASDFMLSAIYDPLNVLPTVVGRTKAKIAETRVKSLAGLSELSEVQAARLKIETIKADIYRATPGMSGMVIPWNEASRRFRKLIVDVPDVAKHLTWGERIIAGVTPDGKVKELLPNAQKVKGAPLSQNLPIAWKRFWSLQPEARANLFRDKLTENIQVVFDWSLATGKTDPKAMIDVIEAASKMDMVTLREAGAEFMGSPEAYTTIGAARDVLPKLRADQLAYEALARNREQFHNIAGMIGDDPKLVLEGFLKDDARPMFERLKEKLRGTDTPEAKALLKAIDEGKLTAGELKQTFKPLETAPLNDIEFMARINERMYDHLKDWGKEYFQVKDHNVWDESLRLLKGAQSLLLLDVNPYSILNDFVNERIMLLTEGTLGLTSGKTIDAFKQEFGVWPELAGGSGLLGDIATEKTKLSASMKENKGIVGKAADKLNLFRSYLPRSAAASRFNAAHHQQMIYSGVKEYWGRNWIEGRGFDRMPASLEARLREYNMDPQLVYRNARSILKPEQLEILKTRATSHDIGNYIADAAEKVGKTPGELTALMDRMGVVDELRQGLEKADTPAKRDKVFDGVDQKVQDYIDRRIAQEIPGKIQDYIDKIKTEAHGGAMQVFNEVALQTFETRLEVDKIWDEAYAKAAEVDFEIGRVIKGEAARQADTVWRRTQTRQAMLYTGVAEGLGFKDEFRLNYLKSLGDQQTILRNYFQEKSRAIERYFNTEYTSREARSAEWYTLEAELNTRFAEEQSKVLKIQEGMNDLFVDEMRAKYGEPAGVMANAWVTKTLAASTGIHEMIVAFRDSIKGMDPEQRANAWKRFKPEFQAAYYERTKVDMAGAAELWKGEESPPPDPLRPSDTSPKSGSASDLGEEVSIIGEVPAKETPTAKELAEAQKQRRVEAARQRAESLAPIWEVAERYPYLDAPFNRNVDNVSLLAILRKEEYGGIRDLSLDDPRLTPELVSSVLEARRQITERITETPVRMQQASEARAEIERLNKARKNMTPPTVKKIKGGGAEIKFADGSKNILSAEEVAQSGGLDGVKQEVLRAQNSVIDSEIALNQRRLDMAMDGVLLEAARISISEVEGRLRELEAQYIGLKSDRAHLGEFQKQLIEIQDNLIVLEQAVPDDAPRALQAQLITTQEKISKRLAVLEDYIKAQEIVGFERALETDPESPLFEEAPSDPRALFKDGGDLPLLAPGAYDQLASRMDATKIFEDGWSDQIRPALEAMKESANSPERRYTFKDMDAQTQRELNQYLGTLSGKMASAKHAASKWGEVNAEYGLLNYDRQYGFDKIFSAFVPYEFFGTRSAANWMARIMDRPAFVSQYVRYLNLRKTYENDLPERMRGKLWLPTPFMPDWAGDGVWFNPTYQLVPFTQFIQPLQAYKRDNQNLINNAMYVLRDMAEADPNSKGAVENAMQTQSGPIWERALAQAKAENENTNSGADYFSMLFSPALYMTIPYYLATGKKLGGINTSWPSGQLPITKVGSAMETAFKGTSSEWIGDVAGLLARPENYARKQLSLSEFGEWGEYYIERQLVNMAAEDGYDPKEVYKALIEKTGPLYEEATNRVRYELMLKVPGMAPLYAAAHDASLDKIVGSLLTSLYPAGILPAAEMEYRGLKQEFNEAWKAKNNGNDEPMDKFWDDHPEYSARLALRKDPEERMQQFLVSEVWDAYGVLGATDRKQAVAELGLQEFFDGELGTEYTMEQLVTWVRGLKGMVPKTPVTEPMLSQPAPQINYYDKAVTMVTDEYFSQRTKKFPNFYEEQTGYYALPKSERNAYLLKTPGLKEYWDWKDAWYKKYPQYVPVFNGQVFKQVDTSGWPPGLMDYVISYAYTGKKMPSGAMKALEQQWIVEGMPMDDLKSWLDNVVAPAMMYGE